MGTARPKQLLELNGRTVLEHSLAAFCATPEVDDVLVLVAEPHHEEVTRIVRAGAHTKVTAVLAGGAERSDTSRRAVDALSHRPDSDVLLLHDAARPLVRRPEITSCIAAATSHGAAGVAVPASDTIVEARAAPDGTGPETIARVPRRDTLRRMQTPQGFRLGTLRRAHELAHADPDFRATDDCGVVLRYLPETAVALVPGGEHNIKITHPGDLAVAAALLTEQPLPEEPT